MPTICDKNHRYNPMFSVLPDSQASNGRHKCTACAYELGLMNKAAGIPRSLDESVLDGLPDSQAGEVRHKDAFSAYNMAYDY